MLPVHWLDWEKRSGGAGYKGCSWDVSADLNQGEGHETEGKDFKTSRNEMDSVALSAGASVCPGIFPGSGMPKHGGGT